MKKNLLSILILVLLVVNIVMSVIMMISVTGTNKKTADLITSIATVLNLELYQPGGVSVADVPVEDVEMYDITDLMIPVSSETGKKMYVIFNMSLQQNTKHKDYKKNGGADNLAQRESMIKDTVNLVVSSHTLEEFQEDTETIREEMLKEIQRLYSSDFIYRISIYGIKYSN